MKIRMRVLVPVGFMVLATLVLIPWQRQLRRERAAANVAVQPVGVAPPAQGGEPLVASQEGVVVRDSGASFAMMPASPNQPRILSEEEFLRDAAARKTNNLPRN